MISHEFANYEKNGAFDEEFSEFSDYYYSVVIISVTCDTACKVVVHSPFSFVLFIFIMLYVQSVGCKFVSTKKCFKSLKFLWFWETHLKFITQVSEEEKGRQDSLSVWPSSNSNSSTLTLYHHHKFHYANGFSTTFVMHKHLSIFRPTSCSQPTTRFNGVNGPPT